MGKPVLSSIDSLSPARSHALSMPGVSSLPHGTLPSMGSTSAPRPGRLRGPKTALPPPSVALPSRTALPARAPQLSAGAVLMSGPGANFNADADAGVHPSRPLHALRVDAVQGSPGSSSPPGSAPRTDLGLSVDVEESFGGSSQFPPLETSVKDDCEFDEQSGLDDSHMHFAERL